MCQNPADFFIYYFYYNHLSTESGWIENIGCVRVNFISGWAAYLGWKIKLLQRVLFLFENNFNSEWVSFVRRCCGNLFLSLHLQWLKNLLKGDNWGHARRVIHGFFNVLILNPNANGEKVANFIKCHTGLPQN